MFLKQSTAVTVKVGPFVDSTDGNTEMTALTISQADIRLSKNGGTFAQTNNAAGATHDEKGWYGVPLDTTDTATVGKLELHVHETGALPVWRSFFVLEEAVYDRDYAAAATGIVGTAQTGDSFARLGAPAGASVSVDVAAVKADTAAVKLKTDLLPEAPAKNTAFTYVVKMVDATDGFTPETGLTVTMTRSIDGAAFGAATGTVTEISSGHYKVVASAADMNGDVVTHRFTAAGAADLTQVIQTTA